MRVEPLHEKILVRPLEAEKESVGGVSIPQELQKKPCKGIVLAVGCGLKDRPMIIEVGALVYYIYGAGTKITDGENEYLSMRDNECLAQIIPSKLE